MSDPLRTPTSNACDPSAAQVDQSPVQGQCIDRAQSNSIIRRIWLTCVCRTTPCMVASNYVPRRLGLCWSRVPELLLVSAASPSMDHEHGTVCQPILEHQIRPSVPSSVISRPTCFSSSLRCCWQVGSAPFVRRRYECLASSAPFTNIQTYLLTYCTNTNVLTMPRYDTYTSSISFTSGLRQFGEANKRRRGQTVRRRLIVAYQ